MREEYLCANAKPDRRQSLLAKIQVASAAGCPGSLAGRVCLKEASMQLRHLITVCLAAVCLVGRATCEPAQNRVLLAAGEVDDLDAQAVEDILGLEAFDLRGESDTFCKNLHTFLSQFIQPIKLMVASPKLSSYLYFWCCLTHKCLDASRSLRRQARQTGNH